MHDPPPFHWDSAWSDDPIAVYERNRARQYHEYLEKSDRDYEQAVRDGLFAIPIFSNEWMARNAPQVPLHGQKRPASVESHERKRRRLSAVSRPDREESGVEEEDRAVQDNTEAGLTCKGCKYESTPEEERGRGRPPKHSAPCPLAKEGPLPYRKRGKTATSAWSRPSRTRRSAKKGNASGKRGYSQSTSEEPPVATERRSSGLTNHLPTPSASPAPPGQLGQPLPGEEEQEDGEDKYDADEEDDENDEEEAEDDEEGDEPAHWRDTIVCA